MFKAPKPAKLFTRYDVAFDWAKRNARECCHAFQAWRVVREGNAFAVAVYSRNTGDIQGYAD